MRIGEVAKATGLTVDAIRFYEKQRLLRHAPRSEGGFRRFSSEDIENLEFIRHAQQLGFSLQEIRELLLLRGGALETCSHVQELLRSKLAAVQTKIEELKKLEEQLTAGLRQCEASLVEPCDATQWSCPVLRALNEN